MANRELPNNPRAFAKTVAVESWRTPFTDDDRAVADLFIDLVFDEARIGGNESVSECPVRFRLSLKKAELHVIKDASALNHLN